MSKSKKRQSNLLKKGSEVTDHTKGPLQKKEDKRKSRQKVSANDVYKLCEKEKSLNEIAQQLGLSTVSVSIYIERLLRKGYTINIDSYIQPEKKRDIEEMLLTLQTSSIKRVAENLHDRATVEEIRIIRGYLQGKQCAE